MTISRSQQIDLNLTRYYHCVSRCVRRSFLCGHDAASGKSYEHRRSWLEKRIHQLSHIYCIDICAYAIMSNHYHLVIHINQSKTEKLTDDEIIQRWSTEHSLPEVISQFQQKAPLNRTTTSQCRRLIKIWRQRLYSLSWFMRELNMSIAVRANKEDACTGHFWEGRYKSQALLDDKALLAAMSYVDLNPVRARIADTPQTSQYTSLTLRIDSLRRNKAPSCLLFPFSGYDSKMEGLPFSLADYVQWVEFAGEIYRTRDKPPEGNPNILSRLKLQTAHFLNICYQIQRRRCIWIGTSRNIELAKTTLNKRRIQAVTI